MSNQENLQAEVVVVDKNEIIVVEQLPIIKRRLFELKGEITQRVQAALALEVTKDTVKSIKKIRADLNREFKSLEERRMEVKRAVMSPYDEFVADYEDCVTNIFKPADRQLAQRIMEVDEIRKKQKQDEVTEFFNAYCAEKSIDFITLEQTGVVVTVSAAIKGLQEKITAFIDKTANDLAMIEMQEHSAEILVEYKRSLDVSQSILNVTNRHKAIAEEKAKQAEVAPEPPPPPVPADEPPLPPEPVQEPEQYELTPPPMPTQTTPVQSVQTAASIQEVWYKVSATAEQLDALEAYMNSVNIAFEQM